MGSAINPVVSGLLHGFGIASQANRERDYQRQIALAEKREQDEMQIRDLRTQLELQGQGFHPSTPEQDAEALTGYMRGNVKMPGVIGGLDVPVKSDIKERTVKYKGQTYVGESDTQREARRDRLLEGDLGRELKKGKALSDAKGQADVAHMKNQLETLGVALSDAKADELGLPRGTRLLQGPGFGTELGALMRGGGQRGSRGAEHIIGDDEGGQTLVSRDANGKVVETPLKAKGKATKAARPAGSLTDYQAEQLKRQKLADAAKAEADRVKAQTAAQGQVDKLNKEEQALHAENREIGQRLLAGSAGSATNKAGKKVKVTEQDAAGLKAKLLDNQNKVLELQKKQHAVITQFAGGGAANDPAGILGSQ